MTGTRVATLIGVLAVGLAFWANVAGAVSLQMDQRPPGWHIPAIPVAVAVDHFGYVMDYTGVVGVRDAFLPRIGGSDSTSLNPAIAHLLALDPATLSSERYLLGNDDKGVIDFVRLSFLVLGYRVEGLLYTYFLILGLSSACFAVVFYRRAEAMFLLAAFLCGHLAMLSTVVVNPELRSVLAMRFMPAVSLVAVLHLLLYVFRPLRGVHNILLVLVQVSIIVFTIHIRQSAMWQVAAVGLGGVIALAVRAHSAGRSPGGRLQTRSALHMIWPCAAILAGFVVLRVYQHVTYAEAYRNGEQIAGHVFWHSLFTGFAFHPTLGKEFDVRIDDVSVVRATGRYLVERGRMAEWEAIGGTSPGFRDVRWAPYDQVVREMYFDAWRTRPIECLTSALVYRPVAFARILVWLAGLSGAPPYIDLVNDDGQRAFTEMHKAIREGGFAYKPIQLWSVLALTPFLVILAPAGIRALKPILGPGAVLFVGALTPTIAVYPYAHTIGEPAIATTMMLYTVAIVIGSGMISGVEWLRHRRATSGAAVAPASTVSSHVPR